MFSTILVIAPHRCNCRAVSDVVHIRHVTSLLKSRTFPIQNRHVGKPREVSNSKKKKKRYPSLLQHSEHEPQANRRLLSLQSQYSQLQLWVIPFAAVVDTNALPYVVFPLLQCSVTSITCYQFEDGFDRNGENGFNGEIGIGLKRGIGLSI